MGDIDWELVTKICKFAATISGGLLAGCGFYVLGVEQPARMEHKEEAALENWARFYNKAYFVMVAIKFLRTCSFYRSILFEKNSKFCFYSFCRFHSPGGGGSGVEEIQQGHQNFREKNVGLH